MWSRERGGHRSRVPGRRRHEQLNALLPADWRIALDPELRRNVSMSYFESGHMVYIDRKAQARSKKDVDELIRANANVQ